MAMRSVVACCAASESPCIHAMCIVRKEVTFRCGGPQVKADSFFANKRGLASRFRKANSQAV
jgi:hypothetical protein